MAATGGSYTRTLNPNPASQFKVRRRPQVRSERSLLRLWLFQLQDTSGGHSLHGPRLPGDRAHAGTGGRSRGTRRKCRRRDVRRRRATRRSLIVFPIPNTVFPRAPTAPSSTGNAATMAGASWRVVARSYQDEARTLLARRNGYPVALLGHPPRFRRHGRRPGRTASTPCPPRIAAHPDRGPPPCVDSAISPDQCAAAEPLPAIVTRRVPCWSARARPPPCR